MFKKYLKTLYSKAYNKFKHILGDDGEFAEDQQTSKSLFNLFLFAILAIVVVFLFNLIPLFSDAPDVDTPTKFGTWGDFFGGALNPILTFLTFMGLLITIVLQQKELKLTRNVLNDQRKEFEEQTQALKQQQIEMVEQTFDNKFFQMLNSFNKLVSSLELTQNAVDRGDRYIEVLTGKKVFKPLVDSLFQDIIDGTPAHQERELVPNLLHLISIYENFNDVNDEQIRYYFLNLYQLLRYVDQETPKSVDSKQYTNIIRAQLSKYELILLFHNAIGISRLSNTDYLELVEKYELLEHLQFYVGHGLDGAFMQRATQTLSACYDFKAFGKNENFKNEINLLFDGNIPNLRKKLIDGISKEFDKHDKWKDFPEKP